MSWVVNVGQNGCRRWMGRIIAQENFDRVKKLINLGSI